MPEYRTLEFTDEFLTAFAGRDFTSSDRRALIRALRLLDDSERHPSLRYIEWPGMLSAGNQARLIP